MNKVNILIMARKLMKRRFFGGRVPKSVRDQMKLIAKNEAERNIETKLTVPTYSYSVSTTGLNNPLIQIAQGDSATTRTGNQLYLTGLDGMFNLIGSDTTNFIRVVLYVPKITTNSLSTLGVDDAIDLDQFTVLFDKVYSLSDNGNNAKSVTLRKNFHRGRKRGIQVQFSGSAGSTINKNNISLYFVSDSNATPHPGLDGYMRVYYKDA